MPVLSVPPTCQRGCVTPVSLSLHLVDRAREARTCARATRYRTNPRLSLSVKRVTGALWEHMGGSGGKEREREGGKEGGREREPERERERDE